MAHESFESPEVAQLLNRDFISIKVDREERPDVDAVYMAVCQALTGSGGWPLTIIMTPEQKPFWAGTYLPKTGAYGRAGLLELLGAVVGQWDTGREKLTTAGEEIAAYLQTQAASRAGEAEPEKNLLDSAVAVFEKLYDKQWGGFGMAPKFPTPHNLLFLLAYSRLEKRRFAGQMAEHTLTQMFRGGMFDHIGGGFSRYSTDQQWLVPHFEKMLYDNALLVLAYLEALHITGRTLYRTVIIRTLDYVLRELTQEEGGFLCGQDADSEGVEGKYYVFTPEEVTQVLGGADGETFCRWFGVTAQGNFEGKSIPNLIDNLRYQEEGPWMGACRRKLYEYRLSRTRLHKDDKVLTSWNGLMIAAMAKAGWLMEAPKYLQAARRAQNFLEKHLVDGRGRLLLRWREGEAAHAGQLDDYAFYAFALLELYGATFDSAYLLRAIEIAGQMLELFGDEERGGFYLYAGDAEQLISRPKEVYDGALPSGNSVAAVVLVRLAAMTGEERWRQAAHRQLRFVAGAMKDYPAGYSMSLLALSMALYPSQELVCSTAEPQAPEELMQFLRENQFPNLTVLVKTEENQASLTQAAPFTAEYPLPENGSLYYLCRSGACDAPTQQLEHIRRQLLE